MAIKTRDVPVTLIERIEAAYPAPAHFVVAETDDWPAASLPALLKQGALVEAGRAKSIACAGCEWQCLKRVEVRKAGTTSRAFVMCDEEPDYGRVSIPIRSLQRYESDLRQLSVLVAGVLKLGLPKVSRNQSAYVLGSVNGRLGPRTIIVAIENDQLVLGVGEQREPLVQLLSWGPDGLLFDARRLQRLADRKDGSASNLRQYAHDRTQQTARKLATRKRDQTIFQEAKKRHARGLTWSRVAAELFGTVIAQDLTVERVRRIITAQRALERKKSRPKPRKRK